MHYTINELVDGSQVGVVVYNEGIGYSFCPINEEKDIEHFPQLTDLVVWANTRYLKIGLTD